MVKVPLESAVAVKKKEIPFLNEKQADAFYNVLKIKTGQNFEKYKENRNAHTLVLILYTGMRIGEALALKWKNVDLINKKIYIEESAAEVKVNGKYKLSGNSKELPFLFTHKNGFISMKPLPLNNIPHLY